MSIAQANTPRAPRLRVLSLPPVDEDVYDIQVLQMAAATPPPPQKENEDLLLTPPPPTVLQLGFDLATMTLGSLEPIELERHPRPSFSKKTHASRSSRSSSHRQPLQYFNKAYATDRTGHNT